MANITPSATALDRLSQIGNQISANVTGGGRDKILQKNADDVSTTIQNRTIHTNTKSD